MYFRIRLKTTVKSFKILILFLFTFVFAFVCRYFFNHSHTDRVYDIAVIDEDESEASRSLIENFAKIDGVRFIRASVGDSPKALLREGRYYSVYTIKKGYMDKLMKAEMEGLIDVESFSSNSAVKWLNDKLAAIIIKDYVFYDIYGRISENEEVSLAFYKKKAEATEKENEILSLNVIEKHEKVSLEAPEMLYSLRLNRYAVFLFSSLIGMYGSLKFFERLCEMKLSGLEHRLTLIGIGRRKLLLSEFFIHIIVYILCSSVLFVIVENIGVSVFLFSFLSMILSTALFFMIEYLAENLIVYRILSRIFYMFLLIGLMFFMYIKF